MFIFMLTEVPPQSGCLNCSWPQLQPSLVHFLVFLACVWPICIWIHCSTAGRHVLCCKSTCYSLHVQCLRRHKSKPAAGAIFSTFRSKKMRPTVFCQLKLFANACKITLLYAHCDPAMAQLPKQFSVAHCQSIGGRNVKVWIRIHARDTTSNCPFYGDVV